MQKQTPILWLKIPFVRRNNSEITLSMDWVWVRDALIHGAICDTGYYYTDGNLLRYADFTADASTVLCTKAGCGHDDDTCDAYLRSGLWKQLLYWNERIYYFDILDPILYSRDATGVNLKKIGTVASKYIEDGKAVKIGRYAVAADYLYYEVDIFDKVVTDEGVNTTELVLQSVGRINLSTGRDEIVHEEKIEDPADEKMILCAVRNDGLLLNHWTDMDVDPRDPDYVEKRKNSGSDLLHFDIESGKMTVLFEKNMVECAGVKLVSGDKVYYKMLSSVGVKDAGYTYSYDLNTGKTEIACPINAQWYLGGNYIQCIDRETDNTLIYDMSLKKELPFEIEHAGQVWNVADNGFVMSLIGEKEMVYYFVSREALADGLQEADLQPLYSRTMG